MLPSGPPTEPSSPEFAARITAAGRSFGAAGVVGVYLIHGTFAGNDALGLLTELARFAPELSELLRKVEKGAVDLVIGETGNYTQGFAARFEELIGEGAGRPIPVRLFNWSGQNNHVGRADGAVRVLHDMADFAAALPRDGVNAERPPRLLVWAHSHGGNVMAIATHLLASDADVRREFFHAARSFYRTWWTGRIDLPAWQQVEELLADAAHPLRRLQLDVATFGTPVRYGWETTGYAKLMHLINHRPSVGRAEYQAPWPLDPRRMLVADGGDYIQQIGIAGTGLPPNLLAPRTVTANWRLRRLLERGERCHWLSTRLRHGCRVHGDGTTLLIDYADPETNPLRHFFGHAVYTRSRWLPLHCELVAAHFYGD